MIGDDGVNRPDCINIEDVIKKHVQEFIESGNLIEENGLAIGSGGNLSIKVPGGMLVTSTGSKLSDLRPDEIVFVLAANGENVYYFGTKKPSSEAVNHWIIYEKRLNVEAISHVNVGPKDSKNIIVSQEEIPYGTIELGYDTATLFQKADVAMLKNHGVIAVGKSLLEATKLLIDSTDKEKPYIFASGQKKSNT